MNQITTDIYKDFTPLPENLDGWNGTKPVFAKLIDEYNPKHIIEVGTWKGQSAITMAKHIKAKGLPTKITCVDTWLGALEFWGKLKHTGERNLLLKNGYPQIYYQFLSNVVHNDVQDVILPFPNTSFIAAKYFQEQKITADIVYIDGSHEYEDVLQDCNEYWKVVANGGVMFGDDWRWESVKRAVNEFAEKNSFTFTREGDDFWLFRKA
jgi:SAM-dependent methyltransferase